MEKIVSNEEFVKAMNNIDNKKLINSFIGRYKPLLDSDTISSCWHVALFKCLKNHKPLQKFTTSLFRFLKWEFDKFARRELTYRNRKQVSLMYDIDIEHPFEEIDNHDFNEFYLDKLQSPQKEIIIEWKERRYIKDIAKKHGISYNECSKQIKQGLIYLKKCVDESNLSDASTTSS